MKICSSYRGVARCHPRRCREHVCSIMPVARYGGLSAQIREALRHQPGRRQPPGIIPADAGSTPGGPGRSGTPWDHPRRCGEHILGRPQPCSGAGSSPQMRGARMLYTAKEAHVGIIPADAGSTRPRGTDGYADQDHPRRCGEHAIMMACVLMSGGSSPQMRGARPR